MGFGAELAGVGGVRRRIDSGHRGPHPTGSALPSPKRPSWSFCRTAPLQVASAFLRHLEIKKAPRRVLVLFLNGGERQIRTAGTGFPVRLFSKQLVSATHPFLRGSVFLLRGYLAIEHPK